MQDTAIHDMFINDVFIIPTLTIGKAFGNVILYKDCFSLDLLLVPKISKPHFFRYFKFLLVGNSDRSRTSPKKFV